MLKKDSMYKSKTGSRSRMRLQGSTREIRSDEVWFDIEKGYMRSSPSLVGYFIPRYLSLILTLLSSNIHGQDCSALTAYLMSTTCTDSSSS